jgi:outer membrane protein assembly factor BamB
LVDNNTVYIGSFDRYLYALDSADGSLKWKFMAGNWFWAKPVVNNGVVYAACLDGKVYALNAESGNELAEFDLGSPVSSSPVVTDNCVVVASEEGVVYALDTNTNQEKWVNGDLKEEKQKVYASLCAGEGVVYVHTNKGQLYALNAQSGAKLWSLSLKS